MTIDSFRSSNRSQGALRSTIMQWGPHRCERPAVTGAEGLTKFSGIFSGKSVPHDIHPPGSTRSYTSSDDLAVRC
jgi:hypothetical protein